MRNPNSFVSFSLPNSSPHLQPQPPLSSSRLRLASGIFTIPPRSLAFTTTPSHSPFAGANQLRAQYSMDEIHGIDVHDKSSVDFPGSESAKRPRVWSSSPDYGPKTDIGKQIFCNRPLNMKNIVAVGFDMDYTLAQYMPETFESLAYQHTVEKLVYDLKYSRELLSWSFNSKYMVRGLVLDKKRGNILKVKIE